MDWSHLDVLRRQANVLHVQGHRGARGMFPENTLDGIEYALKAGTGVIEIDILATSDGEIVVSHNAHLHPDTTQNKAGDWLAHQDVALRDLTLAELQTFQIGHTRDGSHYRQRFPEQCALDNAQVPTLRDVMRLMSRPEYLSSWLIIEVKSDPFDPGAIGPMSHFVARLDALMRDSNMERRSVVQSFDWNFCLEMQKHSPDCAISCLSRVGPQGTDSVSNIHPDSRWIGSMAHALDTQSLPEIIHQIGGQIWAPYHADTCKEDVETAHQLGLLVIVWTVNDNESAQRMIDCDVDGIITDYPVQISQYLHSQGLLAMELLKYRPS